MATEFALKRSDKGAIGSFAEVESLILDVFPGTKFFWTSSGQEKLRIADERGIVLPAVIRESLERLPSLREGRFQADDCFAEFGLGHQEPVLCLYFTVRGEMEMADLEQRVAKLEAKVGGKFVVSGEETNRVTSV